MIYGKSQAVLVSSGPGSHFPAAIRPDLGRTGPEEIISQELVILLLLSLSAMSELSSFPLSPLLDSHQVSTPDVFLSSTL